MHGRDDGREIVQQSERKASIDKVAFAFTTNCDALTRWAVIAHLHDDAISLGYGIVEVERFDGRHGPCQSVVPAP